MSRALTLVALAACTACTPGSFAAPNGGAPGPAPSGASSVTIDANVNSDPGGTVSAGGAAGYNPLTTTVSVGSLIRFTNSDSTGFNHTATSIPGTSFPSSYPTNFGAGALTYNGTATAPPTLSGGFTTGDLSPGSTSGPILADKSGTYIFGCFFHYLHPMRAEIVVK